MRSHHRLLLILALVAVPAFAQKEQPKLEPLPEPPPPPEGVNADSAEPQVTIKKRDGDTIEEYRIAGQLYMIKVTPKTGVPYYLIDSKGTGVFSRYDPSDKTLSVPQWVIKEW
ncbi:DUF2782 domain-containing protein [Niveibacterium sp. SC-1]|uniref:DUF2782 domain-containing protein n=1 Tax=Niveibacterium sp. SC-1 TaxID=3135646 RepID=UPI00311E63D6